MVRWSIISGILIILTSTGRKNLSHESALNVSSQFIIDRDGSIYQLMPPNQFARHTIGLNYCAIGVENIGGSKQPLTEAQVEANAKLIRYLTKNILYSILLVIPNMVHSGIHLYGKRRILIILLKSMIPELVLCKSKSQDPRSSFEKVPHNKG